MLVKFLSVSALVCASVANAQQPSGDGIHDSLRPDYTEITGKSSATCTKSMLNQSNIFNICIQVPLLMTATVAGPKYVDRVQVYLEAFCAASNPDCDAGDLEVGWQALERDCSDDFGKDPAGPAGMLTVLLQNYKSMKRAICNQSVSGKFCVIETFENIHKATNITLDAVMVKEAINRKQERLDQLKPLLDSGILCTGCVSAFLYTGNEFNTTVSMPNATSYVQERCGPQFGLLEYPIGVYDPSKVKAMPSVLPTPKPATSAKSGSRPQALVYGGQLALLSAALAFLF